MYKMFVSMLVSLMVVSFSVRAMDTLPSALPSPELIKEMEQQRKIRELNQDLLSREKYATCQQIFSQESNEIKNSIQDTKDSLK